MEPVTGTLIQLAILAALAATGGPMVLPTLKLFSNNIGTINKNTKLADFTECTFTGYVDAAGLVWSTAYIDLLGAVRMDIPGKTFTCTGTTVVETAYGWYLTDAAGTGLILAGMFQEPIPMTAIGDGVTVQPTYAYGD